MLILRHNRMLFSIVLQIIWNLRSGFRKVKSSGIMLAFTVVRNFVRNFQVPILLLTGRVRNNWYNVATHFEVIWIIVGLILELFLKQLRIYYINRKTYFTKGISQGRQNTSRIGCDFHVFNILTFPFKGSSTLCSLYSNYIITSPMRCLWAYIIQVLQRH